MPIPFWSNMSKVAVQRAALYLFSNFYQKFMFFLRKYHIIYQYQVKINNTDLI